MTSAIPFHFGRADPLGAKRRAAFKHRIDGAARHTAKPQGHGLGTGDRPDHKRNQPQAVARRIYFVGPAGTDQSEHYRQSQPSQAMLSSPKSPFGALWLFWMPPFFKGKRIFDGPRGRADRLAAVELPMLCKLQRGVHPTALLP